PAGLLDLLGDRRPHLVEDVVDLLAVDPDLVGQRHGLRVVHEVVELVDENEYVHESSEFTEETLFVTLAEEPSEEASFLRGFRGGVRFRRWLRLRLQLWLPFKLPLALGLGLGLRFRLRLWLRLLR